MHVQLRRALIGVVSVAAMCFVTAPTVSQPVRFGLFADLHAHDTDSPLEQKWMTYTEERLLAFTRAMNETTTDFVIQLGDFVNGWVILGADPGDPYRIPDLLAWADSLYATYVGPRYHVVGNHDVYNLDKEQICEILGLDATYYSFDVSGFHFVVLDVQFDQEGDDLAYTYTGVYGFAPLEELEWLRQDLAASGDPTVVFVHQRLDGHLDASGRTTVLNQEAIRTELAAAGNVIAVFQGHDHDNAYSELDGIHYITFEALVDQNGTPPSWALVTLDPQSRTLSIAGEGAQADWTLSFSSQEAKGEE